MNNIQEIRHKSITRSSGRKKRKKVCENKSTKLGRISLNFSPSLFLFLFLSLSLFLFLFLDLSLYLCAISPEFERILVIPNEKDSETFVVVFERPLFVV